MTGGSTAGRFTASRRRLRALSVKELAQIRRDPSTFLIAFLLPMVLLFIFGYAISLDANHSRIALVVEDDSPAAFSLAGAFARSRSFEVHGARAVAPVRDRMIDGSVRGIIVIPQDFGAGLARGRPPAIQIITDGSQPNTASLIAGLAEGVRASWLASQTGRHSGAAPAPPITVESRYWYNPGLRSRYFLVPGSIAIIMTMIGTLLTALVVAREWERGTMEAMLATPMRMAEFIASKLLPYFVLGLVSMAACAAVAVTAFQVPFRGSLLGLTAISAAFLMPALGMGLFISATTRNQFVASQIALLSAFLPTFLLSGFLFEIASMPAWLQAVTYIVPARYFIPALQTVFLVGDVPAVLLPNIAVMLGFGAGFFLLAFRATRRSLD